MIIIVIIILNSQKHFCLLSHSTVSMWARLDDFFEVLTTPHPSFSPFLLLFPSLLFCNILVSDNRKFVCPTFVPCFVFFCLTIFNWPDSKLADFPAVFF